MKRLILALAATAVFGCGGIVTYVNEKGGDGGHGDGGSAPSAPGAGGSPAGASSIKPTITGVALGANCMPSIGPDPVSGNVIVDYENSGSGSGSMNIVAAEIQFVNPMEGWVFPINLSPTASGSISAMSAHASQHDKVATDGNGSSVCSFCDQQGQVELRFIDDQGLEAQASSSFTLGCSF